MAHITALLIVLTLAGDPAVNALCINWCHSPSDRQPCDDAIASPLLPTLSIATNSCVTLLTSTPFVREEVRDAVQAAPAAVHSVGVLAPGVVRHD